MNFWVNFALGIVLNFLQSTIKNPQSIAQEKAILTEIRDALNQLLPPNG